MSEKTKSTLLLSLIDIIDTWIGKEVEKDHWEDIGYVPPDISELMARAAVLVLETSSSASHYAIKETGGTP